MDPHPLDRILHLLRWSSARWQRPIAVWRLDHQIWEVPVRRFSAITLETAVRRSLVGGLIVLIAGGGVLGAARSADAAEFFAMIAILTGIKKPNAFVEATVDTRAGAGGPFDVEFTVFDTAGGFA